MTSRTQHFPNENRGISVATGYTATLAVTAIILTVIITGASGILQDETAIIATDQLETTGETLSNEINSVYRIANTHDETNQNIEATVDLSDRTVEGQYFITVTNDQIKLETSTADISQTIPVPDHMDEITITSNGRINGGDVTITYTSSSDEIVINEVE